MRSPGLDSEPCDAEAALVDIGEGRDRRQIDDAGGERVGIGAGVRDRANARVFGWRRKAALDARGRNQDPMFAAVAVEEDHKTDAADGVVELVIGDVTVRVGADISPARIMEIVRAIRAA